MRMFDPTKSSCALTVTYVVLLALNDEITRKLRTLPATGTPPDSTPDSPRKSLTALLVASKVHRWAATALRSIERNRASNDRCSLFPEACIVGTDALPIPAASEDAIRCA